MKANRNKKEEKSIIHHPTTQPKTFGQKAADKLTKWAGSWTFIILFFIVIILWISANLYFWLGKQWDPFPFILLNLALSLLASIQAPIILMAQNREAQKDRQRAEYDYAINRKAEKEIQEIKQLIKALHKRR